MAYGAILGQIAPPPNEAGVTSFNGRTGEVVPQKGDYTAEQVGAIGLDELRPYSPFFFKAKSKYYKIYGSSMGYGGIIPLTVTAYPSYTKVEGIVLVAMGSTGESSCGLIYDLKSNFTYKPKSIEVKELTGDLSYLYINSYGFVCNQSTATQGIGYFTLTYDSLP